MTPNFIICNRKLLICAVFVSQLNKLRYFTTQSPPENSCAVFVSQLNKCAASLLNLHPKIFNDRIRQNVVGQLLGIGPRVFGATRSVDGNLEILSLPNVADPVKAQQF